MQTVPPRAFPTHLPSAATLTIPPVEIIQPRWATWTFLLYAGGFTILGTALGWLAYFSATSGNAGYAAWALLLFAVLAAVAEWFRRAGHPITAGLFAFAAVAAFVALVGALWTWFSWLSYGSSSFGGFHLSRLFAELLWVAATVAALVRFRYPLLVAQFALASWLIVTDMLSGGGGWSAVVTLLVGFCFLGAGLLVDLGSTRPYGFWLHVAAGLLIGGSVIYLMHHGTLEWTLIAIASVVYIGLAQLFRRSSWAVFGALGLLIAAGQFTLQWTHIRLSLFEPQGAGGRGWVPPLVFGCAGALLVLLGLVAARRREQPAVV
ncbi:MAG: hypothetical protein QOH16_2356 [Gaiellaceae bacterium]|nr:hypothetical protein [Gaiellaceae bacterium]